MCSMPSWPVIRSESSRCKPQELLNDAAEGMQTHPWTKHFQRRAHFSLPCVWNLQLSDNRVAECSLHNAAVVGCCLVQQEGCRCASDFPDCTSESSGQKSHSRTYVRMQIHWNSPKKLDVAIKERGFFIGVDRSFQQMEGNLLRRSLAELACKDGKDGEHIAASSASLPPAAPADSAMQLTNNRECLSFDRAATMAFRTHLYYLPYDHEAVEQSQARVTIVTQMSADRLGLFETLCKSWSGPVSVALYASDHQVLETVEYLTASPTFTKRHNIALHVVYQDGEHYPVNYLRNVALRHATTAYVLSLDVDFAVSPNLRPTLDKAVDAIQLSRDVSVSVPALACAGDFGPVLRFWSCCYIRLREGASNARK